LRRALARAHAGLGRLLRERTVGEDVDPDLAAALDVPGHRDTRGLDLAVRDVRRSQRLDPELAEVDLRAAGRLTGPRRVVLLAVLDLAWDEHDYAATPAATGASDRGPRRGPRSPRSGREDFWEACSRASSLFVRSPL